MPRTSPTRGSPSGSTRGRGASLGAAPGCSTNTTRSACRPHGPAGDSSTGTASTSTAGTRSIPGSSARSTSPTRSVPAGRIPKTRHPPTPESVGRDGRPYGPLPRSWAHYKGLYHHGDQVILAYTVGTTDVLETPGREIDPAHPDTPIFTRTLEIGPTTDDLSMRVAAAKVAVSLVGEGPSRLVRREGMTMLSVPRSGSSQVVKVLDVERRRAGARRLRGGLGPVDVARAAHPRRPSAMARSPQDPGRDRPR